MARIYLIKGELGEHIVSAYGSPSDESVVILKKHQKDNYQEIQDLIMKLSEGK